MSNDTDKAPQKPHDEAKNREMYAEIAALIATLAKAFALEESAAAEAVESGAMTLNFAADANGNRFVAATFQGKEARIYQDAIKHPGRPA